MPGTSDTSATWATQILHKWNTSATRVHHKWHKYNASATQATRVQNEQHDHHKRENCDFDNDTNEIYFHTPILATWQMKDYK